MSHIKQLLAIEAAYRRLLLPLVALAVILGTTATAVASPVSGAVYTSVNPAIDGSSHCLNGAGGANEGLSNCNIYDDKKYVWLSGGPEGRLSALAGGKYFFAVLAPGGPGDTNDGDSNNLSDLSPTSDSGAGDSWQERSFEVKDGVIYYQGSHDFDRTPNSQSRYGKIRLMGYDDTTNKSGEYILAVCSLTDADSSSENPPGVDPSDCKYDAFRVRQGEDPPAQDLLIEKTASPSYDKTYGWQINKDVDKTLVQQIGGNTTFNYTVTVSHDGGSQSGWQVNGQIKLTNPNRFDVSQVDVSDTIDNNGDCQVKEGQDRTVAGQGQLTLDYSCSYSSAPEPSAGKNTATAIWFEGGDKHVSAEALYDFAGASVNSIDECANISDSYNGSLGSICVGDLNPQTFQYSRTVAIPANDCLAYDNTASLVTDDQGITDSASKTVTVCGPAKTGALTIGFWKTTNGQNLINNYCVSGSNTLAGYLRSLGNGSGPFADAPTTKCADLAKYISNILTGASATDMNKMLRAQMLASALDVWFTGSGWTASSVNKIKPPSTFLANNNLGSFKIDLKAVCPMVDNTTNGTASCRDNKPSTNAFTSGVVPQAAMTMQQLLNFASINPPFNGLASTPLWYSGDRVKQEVLKNIYDQFNNQLAFTANS